VDTLIPLYLKNWGGSFTFAPSWRGDGCVRNLFKEFKRADLNSVSLAGKKRNLPGVAARGKVLIIFLKKGKKGHRR